MTMQDPVHEPYHVSTSLPRLQPMADEALSALMVVLAEDHARRIEEGRASDPFRGRTFSRSELLHGRAMLGSAYLNDERQLVVNAES